MILVKKFESTGKNLHPAGQNRSIYRLPNCYRKFWWRDDGQVLDEDMVKLKDHISILKSINPGYVLDYGKTLQNKLFIDFNIINGTQVSIYVKELDTIYYPKFIKKIHDFIIENLKQTLPYAQYDWVLSNFLVDKDNINLVDWDNVDIYSKEDIRKKLHSDMKSENILTDYFINKLDILLKGCSAVGSARALGA